VGTGWLPTANTLAIAAVAPFVGYLQDLFGKRYIALFGAVLLCVGCAVVGSAHSFGQALVGMALSGAGAGIGELTGYLLSTCPVHSYHITNNSTPDSLASPKQFQSSIVDTPLQH
jgi:MFS family permease